MPYIKDPAPAPGTSASEMIRYYDRELEKLQVEHTRLDAVLEAVNIIGVIADWFWDDTGGLGEPPVGHMRANVPSVQNFTVITVNYIDQQGRDIRDALKTSTIEVGDQLSLLNQTGQGGGVYDVDQETLFSDNHFVVFLANFQGANGNPSVDDVMEMRWEFNTTAPQAVI